MPVVRPEEFVRADLRDASICRLRRSESPRLARQGVCVAPQVNNNIYRYDEKPGAPFPAYQARGT